MKLIIRIVHISLDRKGSRGCVHIRCHVGEFAGIGMLQRRFENQRYGVQPDFFRSIPGKNFLKHLVVDEELCVQIVILIYGGKLYRLRLSVDIRAN